MGSVQLPPSQTHGLAAQEQVRATCTAKVRIAYAGFEALQAAKTLRPKGVLLLVMRLLRISGYGVLKRLLALPGFETSVLIAMTEYGQEED